MAATCALRQLPAEHSAFDGLPIREYVWLDDLPLAVIDGSGAVFWVHAGQLDEPLVMTDAGKAKVWDAYLDPYGKAQVFAVAPAALELRLPGQWEQLETGGLFQNWHRDYDPSLGRYIEADPLGIEVGQNLYAYVDGQPTEWSDPEGLAGNSPRNNPTQRSTRSQGFGTTSITPIVPRGGIWTPRPGSAASNIRPSPWPFGPHPSQVQAAQANAAKVCLAPDQPGARYQGLGGNPFQGRTAEQIEQMLLGRGFTPRGPNPLEGQGTYVSPQGRGYHLNLNHPPPKPPHVGVHRPRGHRDRPPRDYPTD